MGKRRGSKKKVATKKKATVDKVFKCPFCAHDKACEVTMDKKSKIGTIACRVCGQDYQCRINYLSDPIDVFSEWVDACEAEAQAD